MAERFGAKQQRHKRHRGPNGLPTLLDGVGYQESSVRKTFFAEANKLLRKLRLRSKPFKDPQERQAFGVLQGFKVLGSLASNAIPTLEMLATTNLPAAAALYFIGPMSVSALTNALTRSSTQLQLNILIYLSEFGTNAGSAFPACCLYCKARTNMVLTISAPSRRRRWAVFARTPASPCRPLPTCSLILNPVRGCMPSNPLADSVLKVSQALQGLRERLLTRTQWFEKLQQMRCAP